MFGFANPKRFEKIRKPLFWLSLFGFFALLPFGLYEALYASPPDYQQGESVRIMYVHVPAAWLSLFVYANMALAAIVFVIWKHTLAGLFIKAAAPIGLAFTIICLMTGSLWGKPMWNTWWEWGDARLMSVLILFFIYIGIMGLIETFEDEDKGLFSASWLTIVGVVNLPIIKFSVEWWNTLHQPPSISTFEKLADPSIHIEMIPPLFLMTGVFFFFFLMMALMRLENEMLARRQNRVMRREGGR